ncbi:hypothetical protein BpHYR1_034696 [Brachionus plicatilis]|uniref:Uncharacterized protein n=1 Tax=Brachionus plicatilis TaxID=10195 RepID=A0A3M7SH64_BRAPC|nr:hypothetical protein BpHYR1_034696 [Brachionus plicatilis]
MTKKFYLRLSALCQYILGIIKSSFSKNKYVLKNVKLQLGTNLNKLENKEAISFNIKIKIRDNKILSK